jgi:hypothetical protein
VAQGCLRDWWKTVEATEAKGNEYHQSRISYLLPLIYASTQSLMIGIM